MMAVSGSAQLHQAPEHQVVKTVHALDHLLVYLEIFLRHVLHTRGMVREEVVARMVERIVGHRQEVPLFVFSISHVAAA